MTQHCHRQGRAGHAPLPRDVGDDEHAPGDEIDAKPLMLASALAAFSPCGFAEDIDFGKMSYESSCAACHGQSGKGDGPVSADLRTKPTDLTLIAKKNGGVFPAETLYRIIDGRKTIRAHGTYEMPVWGLVFLRSDPEDVARSRILAIIAYLKSLQLEQ